jgi:hypothetical protein
MTARVGVLVLLMLLCGCAADWRSQGVMDLWSTRVGAWLLQREFSGMQVQPSDPQHAAELARVHRELPQTYAPDPTLEVR